MQRRSLLAGAQRRPLLRNQELRVQLLTRGLRIFPRWQTTVSARVYVVSNVDRNWGQRGSLALCADRAEKASRIETIFPSFTRRNWLNAIQFEVPDPYHYCRVNRE